MLKFYGYLFTTLFMVSYSTAYAQNQPTDLKQVYQATLEQYPGLDIKKAEIKEKEYQAKRTKAKQLPQAKVQMQNSFGTLESSTGAFFPLAGTFNVTGNPASEGSSTTMNTYGSVLAQWEIFTFGKFKKENEAAGFKIKEAESNFESYEIFLKSTVSRLYLSIIYNELMLNWADRNTLRVKDILDVSTSLANAGLKPGADTALASSSYLQIQSDLNLWKGILEGSKYQLNEFTAVDIKEITVNTRPFLDFNSLGTHIAIPNTQHPYLNTINHQIDYQKSLEQSAGRAALPSLSVLGGYSARGSGAGSETVSNHWKDGFSNGKTNYLVGLGITWNLTGIYDSKIEQKRIQQNKIATRALYKQQESQMHSGINSTQALISEQSQQVSKTKASVEKAQEAYQLYRKRYESGLINLTELLQIQSLLQQAEKKEIEAFKDLWMQFIIQSELTNDFTTLFDTF